MINTLTENARKVYSQYGHITLSTKETDEYVEISVSDDGLVCRKRM